MVRCRDSLRSCACRPTDKIPNHRNIVLQISAENEVAALAESCLTTGHVVCVADPPARTASERAAAEESDTKESAEASTEVRQTGRTRSSLIIMYM